MIEIVKAEEHHEEELGNLWIGFMRFSQDIDPIHAPRDGIVPVFIKDYLRPAMSDDNSLVLVALNDEEVVGYSYSLICEPHPLVARDKYGCIHDMYISASHRHSGIGEKMLGEIAGWFDSKSIDRIELDVMAQNQIGLSFWKKHGFQDLQHHLYLNKKKA